MATAGSVGPFGFGRNWKRFVERNFNEDRADGSRCHILDFLRRDNLVGQYFLDVGCGSGLHSLAALRSGAARVVSFDIDPDAVRAASKLREYAGNPSCWKILHGSILDGAFVASIDPADIVYSWGVLHHTGDMWKAMDNAALLMKDSGVLYLALYDLDACVRPSPEFWLAVKRRYNRAGWLGKRSLELGYIFGTAVCGFVRSPARCYRRRAGGNRRRGMAFYTDVVDWLGGWPMEFARKSDVEAWAGKSSLETVVMKAGEANTEYLFRRRSLVRAAAPMGAGL